MRFLRFLGLTAILALAIFAPGYATAIAKPIGKLAAATQQKQVYNWAISSNRKVLMLTEKTTLANQGNPTPKIYKAPQGEGWFHGKHGLAAYSMTPGGSPMVVDPGFTIPDESNVVSDVTAGTLYMTYDANNNLDVNVQSGSITLTGSLPAGNNQIGRLDQVVPQQSGTQLQNGCVGQAGQVCVWTTGTVSTVFYLAFYGTSMTGTQTVTCWDSATNSGTIIAFTANWGNTQIITYGPNGRKLTSGKVTCATAGSVLGANMVMEAGVI